AGIMRERTGTASSLEAGRSGSEPVWSRPAREHTAETTRCTATSRSLTPVQADAMESGYIRRLPGGRPALRQGHSMLHFSMPRICLCLSITLFVATAAPVLARETKHSSPKGGSCAEAQAAAKEAAPATQATPVTDGERESRSQPTV